MILVDAVGVGMSRPTRPLFTDVSVTLASGDRLGVVGINGTGKSTLLAVLSGTVAPETGTVRRGRGVTVAALGQVTELPAGSVREAVGAGWRGEAVLDRLGMGDHFDTPTGELSGGQQKRVDLARALVADADLLVLDEPTNHLDVDAIEWLENELDGYRGGIVLITHDRHLLDRVATRVLELDRGTGYTHEGGYDAYLTGRAEREDRLAATESTRRNLARRELAWLRRGAQARSTKSRARIQRAAVLLDGPAEPSGRVGDLDLASLHADTPRLGDQVVELHDVAIGFPGGPTLATDIELLLDRRDRLGIVGANGSGKTTLLEVLSGERKPLEGRRVVGSTAVIALHDQHGRDLDPRMRVCDAVAGDGAEPTWWDAALLERFWFDADAQRAPIELLSGGERRRLQLVLTLAARPNVLLLDEPTNDLDLDTLRSLEDFLDDWPGAVVVVSHDRTFLDRTVDDVVVLDAGRARRRPGGYAGWLTDRQGSSTGSATRSAAAVSAASSPGATTSEIRPVSDSAASPGRSVSTIRHELRRAEREMEKHQTAFEELTGALNEAGADHAELARLGAALAEHEAALSAAEEVWLALGEELEFRRD